VTAGKLLNHWGWLLAAATLLTALSLVPSVAESPSLEWVGWLGTPGTLVALMILRPASPAGFIVAGVIGFLANMLFLALLLEGLLRGIRWLKREHLAPAA
jgi:hypothetical protein